jgi:hypothetical protein
VRSKDAPEEVSREKLDMGMAREIRRLHSEEGVGRSELAKRYGVVPSTITQVLQGVTWREPTVRRPARRRKALSDEEVAEIKRLRSSGLSYERIGFIVGASAATVRNVLAGTDNTPQRPGSSQSPHL